MVPLAAEPLTTIAGFPVTNSMVNAWIAVIFFLIVAAVARSRRGLVPKGIHNVIEAVVEFLLNEIQKVTGDRPRAKAFLPLVGTIFLFVLFSNWIGQIPGTGSIGIKEIVDGKMKLIPLFRPATSDINLTLAMALFAVVATHIFGVVKQGPFKHFGKFVNIEGIVRSIRKGPMAVLVALIEFGVGLLEIISEFAKVLSLSLRLFGNIFAGEVLLTVMMGIFAYFLPLPFIFLEILVGAIQATVFGMLTLAFLTVATEGHGHADEPHTAHA